MIPLGSEGTRRGPALVTPFLVVVNVAVFVWEVRNLQATGRPPLSFALTPGSLMADPLAAAAAVPVGDTAVHLPRAATLLTHMFLHGSLAHLLGNMLYLWTFGSAVEWMLGRSRFLAFYLAWGLCAATAQVATDPSSTVPLLGASGAIAGVLGAFLVFHPLARIRSVLFLWIFPRVVAIPSIIFLGIWVLLQVLYVKFPGYGPANVAYAAHLGGFGAGLISGIALRLAGGRG